MFAQKEDQIFKLPKKGNVLNCLDWRGITFLSVISKIFFRIIHERIKNGTETKLRREQACFKSNRSCVAQINTVKILTEESNFLVLYTFYLQILKRPLIPQIGTKYGEKYRIMGFHQK
jgi:hypothetical protein